jgi:hypothetical protein
MREETQSSNANPVWLGIGQQINSDRLGRKRKAKIALDCGYDIVLRKIGRELRDALLDLRLCICLPIRREPDPIESLIISAASKAVLAAS